MSDSVRPHPWDSPVKNTGVGCHFRLQCIKVKSESEVAQPCPTLHDPMDCSLPGSSVHGIFQTRVLEWGAIAFSTMEPKLFDFFHRMIMPPVFMPQHYYDRYVVGINPWVVSALSTLWIHMYPFSPELPCHPGWHITLSRVPCAIQSILVGYPF